MLKGVKETLGTISHALNLSRRGCRVCEAMALVPLEFLVIRFFHI